MKSIGNMLECVLLKIQPGSQARIIKRIQNFFKRQTCQVHIYCILGAYDLLLLMETADKQPRPSCNEFVANDWDGILGIETLSLFELIGDASAEKPVIEDLRKLNKLFLLFLKVSPLIMLSKGVGYLQQSAKFVQSQFEGIPQRIYHSSADIDLVLLMDGEAEDARHRTRQVFGGVCEVNRECDTYSAQLIRKWDGLAPKAGSKHIPMFQGLQIFPGIQASQFPDFGFLRGSAARPLYFISSLGIRPDAIAVIYQHISHELNVTSENGGNGKVIRPFGTDAIQVITDSSDDLRNILKLLEGKRSNLVFSSQTIIAYPPRRGATMAEVCCSLNESHHKRQLTLPLERIRKNKDFLCSNYPEWITIYAQLEFIQKYFQTHMNSLYAHSALLDLTQGYRALGEELTRLLAVDKHLDGGEEPISGNRQLQKLADRISILAYAMTQRLQGSFLNLLEVNDYISLTRSGVHFVLKAAQAIPYHAMRLFGGRERYSGYCIIGYSNQFYLYPGDVINIPIDMQWMPEYWGAIFHEVGHIIARHRHIVPTITRELGIHDVRGDDFFEENFADLYCFITCFHEDFSCYLNKMTGLLLRNPQRARQNSSSFLMRIFVRFYAVFLYDHQSEENLDNGQLLAEFLRIINPLLVKYEVKEIVGQQIEHCGRREEIGRYATFLRPVFQKLPILRGAALEDRVKLVQKRIDSGDVLSLPVDEMEPNVILYAFFKIANPSYAHRINTLMLLRVCYSHERQLAYLPPGETLVVPSKKIRKKKKTRCSDDGTG
ncbi:MAG: hypothetical protein H7839_12165 [Magnetococcus sp. YQC-5]